MPYTNPILGNNYIIDSAEPSTGYITKVSGPGIPPTTAGLFARACQYINTDNGTQYMNEGTVSSPSWNSLGDVTTLDIDDNSITSAKLDKSIIKYTSFNLSKANILAMYTTPVEILPAQGADTAIEVISITIVYDFDTDAYTDGGDVYFGYSNDPINNTLFTQTAADTFGSAQNVIKTVLPNVTSVDLFEDVGISITNITTNFTDPGTAAGVARIKIAYRVHTLGF